MVYQVEKMLKDHRDKISDEDAKNVEGALEGTRKAMSGGSVEEISKATDTLTQASHKLAEAMYKSQSGTPGGGAPGGQPGGDGAGPGAGAPGAEKPKDDVVDAEFVDVDDKK
jgi:molecular chaperone DnaK